MSGGTVSLEVGDRAEYASVLKFGTQDNNLTPLAAQRLAEAVGAKSSALYRGRSGKNFIAANTAITRAAVFAAARMAENVDQRLQGKAVLKASG